jgi:hypothetical protein
VTYAKYTTPERMKPIVNNRDAVEVGEKSP